MGPMPQKNPARNRDKGLDICSYTRYISSRGETKRRTGDDEMATAIKKARSPHQPTGQWITAKKRLAIYLRDRMTCVYCLVDLHDADPRDITLDHIKCK